MYLKKQIQDGVQSYNGNSIERVTMYVKTKEQLIKIWLEKLTPEQLKKIAFITVQRLIETEEVSILNSNEGAFWDSCGEPLLEDDNENNNV